MSRIRSKNTRPEIIVRNALTGLGIKYRLHVGKLPGKPDIVIPKKHTVIFINGCFWHQHKGCKRQSMPKANTDYWKKKLAANVMRQKNHIKELKKDGWKVLILWECQTKNLQRTTQKVQKAIL